MKFGEIGTQGGHEMHAPGEGPFAGETLEFEHDVGFGDSGRGDIRHEAIQDGEQAALEAFAIRVGHAVELEILDEGADCGGLR